ncbi:hypothetical protein E2C01_061853 [Portunus trituberculatus]|uniref:Uncharacterized protein n=1 Tax=Portunus trituberculatus TaxID=210409 RepID=A0A5B7HGG5_PORTR|nr:hypothetical protein [Portunus trituberculatus]
MLRAEAQREQAQAQCELRDSVAEQARAQAQRAEEQTHALSQYVDKWAQNLNKWRGEIVAVEKETEQYVREQCELLSETVTRQLNAVEIDSENRVEAAAKQVPNLQEEVAELRATVEWQAEQVTDGAKHDLGAICGHRDTMSEPGGFKHCDAALGGMLEPQLVCVAPTELSTSRCTSPPPTPPCTLPAELYRTQLKEWARRQGEPLPWLAQDLEALVRRAYPGAPYSMVAVLARDHFNDALGDQQLQIYVKQGARDDCAGRPFKGLGI